jgi:transposase
MIADGPRLRVDTRATPTDMRRSFDTLAALVTQEMGRDPLSGDLYLFVNQGCRVAKVLFWDGSGLVVMHERISTVRFAAPSKRSVYGTLEMCTRSRTGVETSDAGHAIRRTAANGKQSRRSLVWRGRGRDLCGAARARVQRRGEFRRSAGRRDAETGRPSRGAR